VASSFAIGTESFAGLHLTPRLWDGAICDAELVDVTDERNRRRASSASRMAAGSTLRILLRRVRFSERSLRHAIRNGWRLGWR
jgi:hypothetical protein